MRYGPSSHARLVVASLAFSLVAAIGAGCNDSGPAESFPSFAGAHLTAAQVTPTAASDAIATAVVNYGSTGFTVRLLAVSLTANPATFSSPVTGIVLHYGPVGVTGPALFTFFNSQVDGPFTGQFGRTLDLSGLVFPAVFPGPATVEQHIVDGETYLNMTTVNFPAGEARGQVGRAVMRATLDVASQVPPPAVPTAASGTAQVRMLDSQTIADVVLDTQGLANVTQIHIHRGQPGAAGPVLFMLLDQAAGPISPSVTLQLQESNLNSASGTLDAAVAEILSRGAYLDVHTQANPDGEIRGQIVP